MARKLPYREGDCFVLPLRGSGFARGVVARSDGKGVVLGYFFGPLLATIGDAHLDADVVPSKAKLISRFGDLGLLKGGWRVIGRVEPWDRDAWRNPALLHVDEGGSPAFLRHYDDTLRFVGEERIELSAIGENVPRDGLLGYGAVEIRMARLLGGQ